MLTNGIIWRIYKVTFAKPISAENVIEIDFSKLNPKSEKDIESLYLFCKEGWIKSVLGEYHSQKQALSRFYIGAMVLTDPVLQVLRRELRRMFPDVRIEVDEIQSVLTSDVIKRDVMEGENAEEARKKISRSLNKVQKEKTARKESSASDGESSKEESETPVDDVSNNSESGA